jgi:hypothetical protein
MENYRSLLNARRTDAKGRRSVPRGGYFGGPASAAGISGD